MPEYIDPTERVEILRNRIARLNKGSGDYSLAGRVSAIKAARMALEACERELIRGR